MPNIPRLPVALAEARDTFSHVDDFPWLISPHLWTAIAADAGAGVAMVSGEHRVRLTTGGTDNNEAYLHTTNPVFNPAAGRPGVVEALLSYTEAATNAANIAFGLASGVAADLIVDNGGGLRTSGTVLAIHKIDGETAWRFTARNGSSVITQLSNQPAGGAQFDRLAIEVVDVLGTTATVVPTVNGVPLLDAVSGRPICPQLTLAALAAAALFVGAKAGSGASQTLDVDYLAWSFGR